MACDPRIIPAASTTAHDDVPRLGLRAPEAARAIGIGEPLLRRLTAEGIIPCVRLGPATIVYSIDALRDWLIRQTQTATSEGDE